MTESRLSHSFILETKPCYGIDFGSTHSVLGAPLRSLYPTQSLPPEYRDFVSCALNNDHERTTPTRILVTKKSRMVGLLSERKSAITGFKQELGRREYCNPITVTHDPPVVNLGQPTFEIPLGKDGETKEFSVEQVTAMYFRKLLDSSKQAADIPAEMGKHPEPVITNQVVNRASAVLSVPTFWNQAQKQSLYAAAKIGAIDVLSLVYDTTATAIHFATSRFDKIAKQSTPFILLIVDCGFQGFQASFFELIRTNKEVKVNTLSHGWTEEISGDKITKMIVSHLKKGLLAKYPNHADIINTDQRFLARLYKVSEHLKLTLSHSPMAEDIIEIVVGEVEESVQMTKIELEKMFDGFDEIISDTIQSASNFAMLRLQQLNVERNTTNSSENNNNQESALIRLDVDGMEVVGGTTRIPFLNCCLESLISSSREEWSRKSPATSSPFFPLPSLTVGHTLNSDEAVCLGLAKLASQFQLDSAVAQAKEDIAQIPLPSLSEKATTKLEEEIPKGRRIVIREVLPQEVVIWERERLWSEGGEEGEPPREYQHHSNRDHAWRFSPFGMGETLAEQVELNSATPTQPDPHLSQSSLLFSSMLPTRSVVAFPKGFEVPCRRTIRFDMRERVGEMLRRREEERMRDEEDRKERKREEKFQILVEARTQTLHPPPHSSSTSNVQPVLSLQQTPSTSSQRQFIPPTCISAVLLNSSPLTDLAGIVAEVDANGVFTLHKPYVLEEIGAENELMERSCTGMMGGIGMGGLPEVEEEEEERRKETERKEEEERLREERKEQELNKVAEETNEQEKREKEAQPPTSDEHPTPPAPAPPISHPTPLPSVSPPVLHPSSLPSPPPFSTFPYPSTSSLVQYSSYPSPSRPISTNSLATQSTSKSALHKPIVPQLLFSCRTSSSLLQRWGDEELRMVRSDVQATLNEEKRDELERYCYSLLGDCEGCVGGCVGNEEKGVLEKKVRETLDWLSNQQELHPALVYQQKLNELKDWMEPVMLRRKEKEEKRKERDELRGVVQRAKKMAIRLRPLRSLFPTEHSTFTSSLEKAERILKALEEEKSDNPSEARTGEEGDAQSSIAPGESEEAVSLEQAKKAREGLEKQIESAELLIKERENMRRLEASQRQQSQTTQQPSRQATHQPDPTQPQEQPQPEPVPSSQQPQPAPPSQQGRAEQSMPPHPAPSTPVVSLVPTQSFATKPTATSLSSITGVSDTGDEATARDEFWGSSTGWGRSEWCIEGLLGRGEEPLIPKVVKNTTPEAVTFYVSLAGVHADDVRVSMYGEAVFVEAVQRKGTQARVDSLYNLLSQQSSLPMDTRVSSHYTRLIPLPPDTNRNLISTRFRDNVLEIVCPIG